MKRALACATLLAILCLPLATPAVAESHEEEMAPEPIIWVSFLKAQHGKSQELIQAMARNGSGLYGQLLADGKASEWGIAQPITHTGNDPWDVVEWVTFADWAAVDAFVAGFLARERAKTPEERASSQEAYMSAVVSGSHADAVHQSIHSTSNGERPGYIVLGFQKAKPGHGQALTGMWKDHAQPVYEQLLSDGAIQGYGLFTQALHGDHSWTHASWETMPGLAGMEAVQKAFAAAMNEETMKSFMEMVDWEAHRDQVLVVVHYENAASE